MKTITRKLIAADCKVKNNFEGNGDIIKVRYRLWREKDDTSRRYIIGIFTNTGSIKREIGSVRKYALDFYEKVVRGMVTPCTLDDIIEDNLSFGKRYTDK